MPVVFAGEKPRSLPAEDGEVNFGLTDEAIEARRLGVGGSDAPKIWAGEWWKLYLEKIGEAKPEKIMSDWQRAWRHVTETLQLDWYEHVFNTTVSRRGEVAVHPRYTFMRCTLDGWLTAEAAPINAKHLSKWTKEAREWAIERYTPQIVHEAIVTGADYGFISLLHGEKEPEIIKIEADPMFAAELVAKEQVFWRHVEQRNPPPDMPAMKTPMLASEVRKLRTLVVPTDNQDIFEALSRQNNWLSGVLPEIKRFAETDGAAKINGIARSRIKDAVPDDVGVLDYGLYRFKRTKAGAVTQVMRKGDDDV